MVVMVGGNGCQWRVVMRGENKPHSWTRSSPVRNCRVPFSPSIHLNPVCLCGKRGVCVGRGVGGVCSE